MSRFAILTVVLMGISGCALDGGEDRIEELEIGTSQQQAVILDCAEVDYNGDGVVGGPDFAVLRTVYQLMTEGGCFTVDMQDAIAQLEFDHDGDGQVSQDDLDQLEALFYQCFSINVLNAPECAAVDFTNDGVVGGPDWAAFVTIYRQLECLPADLTGDGIVGGPDFARLIQEYNTFKACLGVEV